MSNLIEQLEQVDRSPNSYKVRGVVCGGKRARWYDINEVNRFDGDIYGVSVPQNGMDGAGLILLEDIREVTQEAGA